VILALVLSAALAAPSAEEPPTQDTVQEARVVLRETAKPGDTMLRQGPELALARLHPEFASRLAAAIEEARSSGLPDVGCFSAYRPPAFGVGGYKDKAQSWHAYGLACDMSGIGRPNSKEAGLWHNIATRHGLVNPYCGSGSWWEWNHYQLTPVKGVPAGDPLRKTITGRGPISLTEMWHRAEHFIINVFSSSNECSFTFGKRRHRRQRH
jgi:hypothetical protein